MYETVRIILGVLALTITILVWLARKRNPQFKLADDQRRLHRNMNVNAGAQLILLGIALPIGYFVLQTMFFSKSDPRMFAFVIAGSVLCVVVGLIGLIKSWTSS